MAGAVVGGGVAGAVVGGWVVGVVAGAVVGGWVVGVVAGAVEIDGKIIPVMYNIVTVEIITINRIDIKYDTKIILSTK